MAAGCPPTRSTGYKWRQRLQISKLGVNLVCASVRAASKCQGSCSSASFTHRAPILSCNSVQGCKSDLAAAGGRVISLLSLVESIQLAVAVLGL